MGFGSIWHWLIVLLIVLLVFGAKRLRNVGSDLGAAVKGFRDAMKEGEGTTEETGGERKLAQSEQGRVIEGEASRDSEKPRS